MKNKNMAVALCAVLAVLLLAVYLYSFTHTQAQELYLTPMVNDTKGWALYIIEDGERSEIAVSDIRAYPGTVYMEQTIPEEWISAGYAQARLSPARYNAVFVNGSPVYTNCPNVELSLPVKFPQGDSVNYDAAPAFDLSVAQAGDTITIASASITGGGAGAPMFILTSDTLKETITAARISASIIPITLYSALALLTILLFAYGFAHGTGDIKLLLLTLSALVQMLYNQSYLGWGEGMLALLSVFRQAFWLLPLLYCGLHLTKRRKLFISLLLLCWGISIIVQVLSDYYVMLPMWLMTAAPNLMYLPLVALLILSYGEKKAKTPLYCLLTPCLYTLIGGILLLYIVSLPVCAAMPQTNTILHQIYSIIDLASIGQPHSLLTLLNTLLLFILLLLLTVEHIRSSMLQAETARLLAMKNDLALENIRQLQRSSKALAIARHDELKHMNVLARLCHEEPAKAAEYAASLATDLSAIAPLSYSENVLVNTILSAQAGKAAEKSIEFHAEAILPEILALPDKDVCAVLMNLLDNAIYAAEKSKRNSKVDVHLAIEEGCLIIQISNTLPEGFTPDKFRAAMERNAQPGEDEHGFGLLSAQTVLGRYNGELRYTMKNGMLTLHTAMILI